MAAFINDRLTELHNKVKEKTGQLLSHENITIPDATIIEQASSAATAKFTASLIALGEVVADLTAGLGINTIFFSQRTKKTYAIEKDHGRATALKHNIEILGISNIEVINDDCFDWIENINFQVDTVFVDPSRRNNQGKRVIRPEDCAPDMTLLLPLLRKKTKRVLIKYSPLLDLKEIKRIFPETRNIYIVEYKREVRELLIEIVFDNMESTMSPLSVNCVILKDYSHSLCISVHSPVIKEEEQLKFLNCINDLSKGGYIYEPSPAFMKAACWDYISINYPDLVKFSPNTHLFYAPTQHENFPGRIFKIEKPVGSKDLKKLKGVKINVISRNHPAKAEEIINRYKFKSSEDKYLIAFSIKDEKAIFQAIKMK